MKIRSLSGIYFFLSTITACLIYFLLPGRDIFLHQDSIGLVSNGTQEDTARWEKVLERTPYLSQAWKKVDQANLYWKARRYELALKHWWEVAAKYRDTDAAYASISNIASAQENLGNSNTAADAWLILLNLPVPTICDGGMVFCNYRHEACVRLADHFESKGDFAAAEQFVFQALNRDPIVEPCGLMASAIESELQTRLQRLRDRQRCPIR